MVGSIKTSENGRFLLSLVCLVCGLSACIAQPGKLTGFIFSDSNSNGRYDKGEKPLPDILVSNGMDIVKTDAKGFYRIQIAEGSPVFVIKPRGYIPRFSEDNVPLIWADTEADPKEPGIRRSSRRYKADFPLYPQAEKDTLKIALLGDTQVRTIDDIYYLGKVVGEQLSEEKIDLVIPLGDLVFDELKLFRPLKQTLGKIGAPVYYVYGNHDRNYDATLFQDRDETYESHFGPSYYAFNYGRNSFIVLNTVFPVDGSRKYEGRVDDRQLQFIDNYVKTLPKDAPIHLLMHIPLEKVSNLSKLLKVFSEHPNVSAYAGHTHTQYYRNFNAGDGWVHSKPLMELVAGAVCGSWWKGEKDSFGVPGSMMRDGTPKGYWIMDVSGGTKSYSYKLSGNIPDKQMHIWTPFHFENEKAYPAHQAIYANIYAGNDSTTVTVKIGGRDSVNMVKVQEVDPYYDRLVKLQELGITPSSNAQALGKRLISDHLWKFVVPEDLEEGVYSVEVRASDPYGLDTRATSLLYVDQ